jgi:hypothetical protein
MVPRRGKLNIIVHTVKHEAEAGAGIRPDDEAEDLGGGDSVCWLLLHTKYIQSHDEWEGGRGWVFLGGPHEPRKVWLSRCCDEQTVSFFEMPQTGLRIRLIGRCKARTGMRVRGS